MVRFLVLYHTPEDPAAFDEHYSEIHIPLAKRLPGLLSYTVSRNLAPLDGDKGIYLVAELDFPDTATMQAAFASPAGREAGADIPKFATGGATTMTYEAAEA
jgi:uncharacterized protein (TIGR02118 family)